jgi:hypothetical protein
VSKKRLEKMYNIGWKEGFRAAAMQHGPFGPYEVDVPPPPRVSQGEEDDKARTEIQTEGAVPASGNVEGDNRPSTLTAEEQAIVRNTLRENNARARAEAKRQGVTRRVAPLPAQGEEDVRPASLSNSDPVIDSGRDDGSLVATPTLQAIGGLVERLRTINTQGPIYALCDEAADALLTMESIAVVDKATISAALKANAALQERAELCEGFELRHRQQIDVLLGENRIKEIAIEQISAERDNHESVAKNNYRIVCELTDELGKVRAERDALKKDLATTASLYQARIAELEGALREIELGKGAYSMDRLEHASNCIDEMKSIARAAIRSQGEGR